MPLPARLTAAAAKKERTVIGLISGTSVDAIEAVVARIIGSAAGAHLHLLAHVSVPFSPEFARRILAIDSVREVCAMNFEIGERFAKAALKAIDVAELKTRDVDLIGSHGQTVAH